MNNIIGGRLKALRKRKKLTLRDMAEKLNISPGYLSEVERGKKIPGGEVFIMLKQNFNIDMNDLFALEGKTDINKVNEALESYATDESELNSIREINQIISFIEKEPMPKDLKYSIQSYLLKRMQDLIENRLK